MRVCFFVTCLADQFFAEAAADAVRLLRSLGVEVSFPREQTCCGQPAYNAGHWDAARKMAMHTQQVFSGCDYVVLPSGSCTTMVRAYTPGLFEGNRPHYEAALDLAGRTYELSEFLVKVVQVSDLGRGLAGMRLAYHHGCHVSRELGIREEPVSLLEAAGAEIVPWEADNECCGFGGVFSVKNAPVSLAMADRKLDTLPEIDALTSADGACLMHMAGRAQVRGLGVKVRHLASLLWEARNG